jgi:hypothetical protein
MAVRVVVQAAVGANRLTLSAAGWLVEPHRDENAIDPVCAIGLDPHARPLCRKRAISRDPSQMVKAADGRVTLTDQ